MRSILLPGLFLAAAASTLAAQEVRVERDPEAIAAFRARAEEAAARTRLTDAGLARFGTAPRPHLWPDDLEALRADLPRSVAFLEG